MNIHRDPYVIGRLDSYFTPTIGHVDHALLLNTARLAAMDGGPDSAAKRANCARLRHDIDLLLDRRQALAAAERPRTKETA